MIIKDENEVSGIGLNVGNNSLYTSETVESFNRDNRTNNYLGESGKALTALGWNNFRVNVGAGVRYVLPYSRACTVSGQSDSAQFRINTCALQGIIYFLDSGLWMFEGMIHVHGSLHFAGTINNTMGIITIPWHNNTLTGVNTVTGAWVYPSRMSLGAWASVTTGFYSAGLQNYNQQVLCHCAIGGLPSSTNDIEGWATPIPFYAQGTYANYNIFQ